MASTKGFPVRQAIPGNLDVVDINGDGLNGNLTANSIAVGSGGLTAATSTVTTQTITTSTIGTSTVTTETVTTETVTTLLTFPDASTADTTQVNIKNDLQLLDASAPSTPAGGSKLFSASGHAKYVSEDANAYATGRQIAKTTGTQGFNSAVQAAVTGLSLNVGTGAYIFEAWVPYIGNSNDTSFFIFAGSATTSSFSAYIAYLGGYASADSTRTQTAFGNNSVSASPAMVNARRFVALLKGTATFSVAGTLVVNGATVGGAGGLTTQVGGLLFLYPDI